MPVNWNYFSRIQFSLSGNSYLKCSKLLDINWIYWAKIMWIWSSDLVSYLLIIPQYSYQNCPQSCIYIKKSFSILPINILNIRDVINIRPLFFYRTLQLAIVYLTKYIHLFSFFFLCNVFLKSKLAVFWHS